MGSGDDYEGLEEGTYKCDSCGRPKFYLFKYKVKDEQLVKPLMNFGVRIF